MIELHHVDKWYGPHFQALKNCTTSVAKGEVVVVCGPSGSGKSTLIKCVNALEPIQGGEIILDGIKVNDSKTNLPKLRSRVGMVFQHFELFPHLRINENLCLAQEKVLGRPHDAALAKCMKLLERVGLPISVGVARTKHLAKIASQVAKPDGLVVVDPVGELTFLHDLPVELMWGVGPVTKARLADAGVVTIGQLAQAQPWRLESLLGPALGQKLSALAWNRDPREIKTQRRSHSAGAQSALGSRPAEERIIRPTLLHLADRIATRLRAKSRPGRTVTARVRFADMRSVTRSVTLSAPISATRMLAEVAEALVLAALADHPQEKIISLLAISVSNLEEHPILQLELPIGLDDETCRPGSKRGRARWGADRAVDPVRDRFGWEAIGYGPVALGVPRTVPDDFRQLAEKNL